MNKIQIINECINANTIGITGHIRPDGDCVGSTTALYGYLKKVFPDKEIRLFLEKPAEIFDCISYVSAIESDYPSLPAMDVFFVLDCVPDRTGEAQKYIEAAQKVINIDHHITNENGSGDVNCVNPKASSASEVLFELLEEKYLDTEIAKAIYIGIIHDCGIFHYSNTSPRTLEIAAKLLKYGFDFPKIIDETFYEKTDFQNQIMAKAVLDRELFAEGKCIVSHVTREEMLSKGISTKDFDGIVNQLRMTKGVECAVFMYEIESNQYKISMRSNRYFDVSKVASFFAGGGHVRAAGCTVEGDYENVKKQLLSQILEKL